MTYHKAPGPALAAHTPTNQRSHARAARRWQGIAPGLRLTANLFVNAAWVILTVALAFGLSLLIASVVQFRQSNAGAIAYLQWITAFITVSSVAVFALRDLVKALDTSLWVPFQYSLKKASGIYWQRFQVFLLALAFDILLIALCAAFPTMGFVSHLFLAAVFTLTIFAVRKSIPIAKFGLMAATGVFFAAMTTIAVTLFIVGVPEEEINVNEGEATEMLDEAERKAAEEAEAAESGEASPEE